MFSLTEIATVIGAVASLVAACGSVTAAILTSRGNRKIEEVHLSTNGMRADLIRTTGELRYAEGVKDGAARNGKPTS